MINTISTFIRNIFSANRQQEEVVSNKPLAPVVQLVPKAAQEVVTEAGSSNASVSGEPALVKAMPCAVREAIIRSRFGATVRPDSDANARYYTKLGSDGFAEKARALLLALGYQVSDAAHCSGFIARANGVSTLVCLASTPDSLNNVMERGFGLRALDTAQALQQAEEADRLVVFCAGRITRSVIPAAQQTQTTVVDGNVLMRLLVAENCVSNGDVNKHRQSA